MNTAFFYKERKRTQERCILLKRTDAQPCPFISLLDPNSKIVLAAKNIDGKGIFIGILHIYI